MGVHDSLAIIIWDIASSIDRASQLGELRRDRDSYSNGGFHKLKSASLRHHLRQTGTRSAAVDPAILNPGSAVQVWLSILIIN